MQSRWPIPLVVWSEASVCFRSIAGLACSNPVECMDVCCVCVGKRPLRWDDHSFRGVLPSVCVCVCDVEI